MWNEISSQEDINNLLEVFGYFHDSCIKELKYVSGQYVGQNLGMMPWSTKRELSIIFQRQFKDPSVIEIVFSGLLILQLKPEEENYTGEIYDVNMQYSNNQILWVDSADISEQDFQNKLDVQKCAWLKAKNARWRIVDEFIGDDPVFVYSKE